MCSPLWPPALFHIRFLLLLLFVIIVKIGPPVRCVPSIWEGTLAEAPNVRTATPANDQLDPPRKSFRGYKLLRLNPRSSDQLDWLRRLYFSGSDSSPPFFDLDFWQPPSQLGALVDLTVAPSDANAFFGELKRRNFDYVLIGDDLEQLIQRERQPSESLRDDEYDVGGVGATGGNKELFYRYDRYNPLSRIEEQLLRLREMNPRIVTLYEIGRSHENRSIVTAKVSAREHSPDERYRPYRGPAIWIDAGIHAREWIAPATAMLFLARLVDGYKAKDPNMHYLLESMDWYITPVLNPDGYEYSHTKNRMWRKNRRPALCRQQYFNRICCSGVDLNRNFDWFWSTTGSSADPCHETYHGPSAFSEPEARAVRDFLEDHHVKAFFTLHSYSQLWLIPYGHKRRNYPEDYTKIQRPLSLRAIQALKRLYGTDYQVGSGADLLYEASGASHDYAKGALNIPYSFLIELRPQNMLHSTGFLLPEAEIMDTAEETWEAVRMVADEVLERFGDGRRNASTSTSSNQTTSQTTPATTTASSTTTATTTMARNTTTTTHAKHCSSTGRPVTRPRTTIVQRGRKKMTTTTTTKKPRKMTTSRSSSSKHTFRPNKIAATTTPHVLTSKSFPVATTLAPPNPVRNAKTGTKPIKSGPLPYSEISGSSSATASMEKSTQRKTIVNVKICTGGGGAGSGLGRSVIPPFPPAPEESGEEEEGEEEEGHGTLMEILLPETPRRMVKCRDWSAYCKWWRMHSLCGDPRVKKMCTLSCLIECQI